MFVTCKNFGKTLISTLRKATREEKDAICEELNCGSKSSSGEVGELNVTVTSNKGKILFKAGGR